jgi:hypothetical protein
MKKGYVLTLLVTFLTIQSVLAQNQLLDPTIDSLSQALGSIFAPILGVGFGEFLFAKIMLFFLLFAIIFVALKNIEIFEENRSVHIVLTTITSIFAVRYLKPGEFINAILLPYTALGASLASFLPLLIFFYFVHKSGIGPFGRRAAWAIYGIFFIMLWGTRQYDSLGAANWVYVIGIGFIIISFLFDKTIQGYFGLRDIGEWKERIKNKKISNMQVELEELNRATILSIPQKKTKKYLEREINRVTRGR